MIADSNMRLLHGRNKDPLDMRRCSMAEVESANDDQIETIPFLSVEEKKVSLQKYLKSNNSALPNDI